MTAVTVGSGRKNSNSLAVGALLRYAVAAAAAACCVSGCGPADDGAQCTALGQLFHATGGPQWQRNAGWLKPRVSYCSWAGVTCGGRGGAFNPGPAAGSSRLRLARAH